MVLGDERMENEKIGKYIAIKRKEKGLTQNELAQKLQVTDRAISKWERGRGCPDISLLEPLSNLLEVSVLELLHGEDIIKDENQVLICLLKKEEIRIKRWKIFSYVLINLFLILFSSIFYLGVILPQIVDSSAKLNSYTIVSKSMEPKYGIYDIVYTKKIPFEKLKVNDVIAYLDEVNQIVVIHRVYDKKNDDHEECLVTKGDNNNKIDEDCVFSSKYLGKVVFHVPLFGKFLKENKKISPVLSMMLILGIGSIIYLDYLGIKKK